MPLVTSKIQVLTREPSNLFPAIRNQNNTRCPSRIRRITTTSKIMNPEDLTIFLLDENEVDPEAGRPRYEDDEFEPKPKSLGTIIKESVIFSIALVASVSSLFYMAVSTNNIAYISGVLCCIIAPYSWYQQKDLFEIQKMNDVCESMIKVVEDIQKENNRLQSAVEHLNETQKNMEDVHDILEMVQKSQGKSIKTIGKQIEGKMNLVLSSF